MPSPNQDFVPGTQQRNPAENHHAQHFSVAQTDHITVSRSLLKRVNTPPELNLFDLTFSAGLSFERNQHRRSHSAVGQTIRPEPIMNGCASAGLAMGPGNGAGSLYAPQSIDSIRSPCFVHKNFGGSINIERVLEECRAEEMTHHNLVQTATGVREVARQLGTISEASLLTVGRTVVKTKIKSVMIVTKARDNGLVQLTRDLAIWLMTSPRHGKPYGVRVHVDAKLERSKRFNVDGLYKDYAFIREKKLLHYWTPETCVFADTYDIVITVCCFLISLTPAWRRWYGLVHVLAVPTDRPSYYVFQFWVTWFSDQLQVRRHACGPR